MDFDNDPMEGAGLRPGAPRRRKRWKGLAAAVLSSSSVAGAQATQTDTITPGQTAPDPGRGSKAGGHAEAVSDDLVAAQAIGISEDDRGTGADAGEPLRRLHERTAGTERERREDQSSERHDERPPTTS